MSPLQCVVQGGFDALQQAVVPLFVVQNEQHDQRNDRIIAGGAQVLGLRERILLGNRVPL
ncbi:MAG TPA: hypothetical protein VGJ60_27715 [Chloroflexota bacterium]